MQIKHLPVKQFNEIKRTFQATKQNGFVTAVNARIVHEWLGVKTPFHKWIQRRIEKYSFTEHIDYCLTVDKVVRGEETNYHCTPDMVKQLAMIENSDMCKIEEMVHSKIVQELNSQGLNYLQANQAEDHGLKYFRKGNHKDPYFDSLCQAGSYAAARFHKFKFAKPKKFGGKAFTYTKPKIRKHNKQDDALF